MPANRPSDWREFANPNTFFWIRTGIIVLVVLILILTSYITIPADSVGVLTRFGKYVETVNPGLRFKLPFGIDQVTVVPSQRQLKLEYGFDSRQRGMSAGANENQYPDDAAAESNMLTGDLNMASVEWVVQYRIDDPKVFLFQIGRASV